MCVQHSLPYLDINYQKIQLLALVVDNCFSQIYADLSLLQKTKYLQIITKTLNLLLSLVKSILETNLGVKIIKRVIVDIA